MNRKQIKFILPLPDRNSPLITETPTGRERSKKSQDDAFEQSIRQRWRALALVIKAKLEAVESGIAEFEEEFLAHIVLPNGQTVGEFTIPQIEQAYEQKKMPSMLLLQ